MMKNLRSLLFLMLILTLTLVIASCDMIEEPIDDRLDKLENRIENQFHEERPNHAASAEEDYLSREKVETIALEHAGIAAADAQYMRTEFEYDDGFPVYDVSFHANRVEYEYSIHAESGTILEYDRDR